MSEPSIAFIESSMHLNMALSLMLLQNITCTLYIIYCVNLILIHSHLSLLKCYKIIIMNQLAICEVELRLQDRKEKKMTLQDFHGIKIS